MARCNQDEDMRVEFFPGINHYVFSENVLAAPVGT